VRRSMHRRTKLTKEAIGAPTGFSCVFAYSVICLRTFPLRFGCSAACLPFIHTWCLRALELLTQAHDAVIY
jgi:hypothetical protein